MNKKTQIIVSITGIIIVLFILISFTYGYYLTRITGNTSSTSISVETGIPGVEYTDLTGNELDNIIIEPGATLTKRFKVTNTGNTSATYSIYLVDVLNNFVRTEDVTYKLYRIGNTETFPNNYTGCITNPTDEMYCKLVVDTTEFPTGVSVVKPDEIITTPNTYYTYAMVITYINHPTINQNDDQGHTFSGKINLRPTDKETNPFSEGTLAYNIINNAIENKNGTRFIEPDLLGVTENTSKPAEESSLENESIISYTEDDHGTSYYYRGNVENNYVNFADMCWRIVRIDGNGNTKLILEDQDQLCNSKDDSGNYNMNGNWAIPKPSGYLVGNIGYNEYYKNTLTASDGTPNSSEKYLMDYLHGQKYIDDSMASIFKNFQDTFTESEISKLKSGNWCLSNAGYSRSGSSNSDYTYTLLNETEKMDNIIKGTTFYYDSQVRLAGENKNGYQPTLKCNGLIMNDWEDNDTNPTLMYVGALTADEIVYAGAKTDSDNKNLYLLNDYKIGGSCYGFWSLSARYFKDTNYDYAFGLDLDGRLSSTFMGDGYFGFRPSVTLLSSVSVISGGNGTIEKPYVIG